MTQAANHTGLENRPWGNSCVGSNPTPSAKIKHLGEDRPVRAERTNREQNRSDSAHDSAQCFPELFWLLDGPPDPRKRNAADAGHIDGADLIWVKSVSEDFEHQDKAAVATGQAKFTALALEALPWLHLGASLLVMLWALLGLVLGGRA